MWDSENGLHKLAPELIGGAIHKGFLRKQGANWKTWRNRYFVLTDNVLYYFTSEKAEIPLGAVLLSRAVIEGADETIDKPWCFLVKPKKSYTGTTEWSNRTYYLHAADYVDMNKWIEALLSYPIRVTQQVSYRPSMAVRPERRSTFTAKPTYSPPVIMRPLSVSEDTPRSPLSMLARRITCGSSRRPSKGVATEFYTDTASFLYSSSESEEDEQTDDGSFAVLEISSSI